MIVFLWMEKTKNKWIPHIEPYISENKVELWPSRLQALGEKLIPLPLDRPKLRADTLSMGMFNSKDLKCLQDNLNLSVLRQTHVNCLYRTKSAFPKAAGRNPRAEQRQQLPRQLSKLRNPTKSPVWWYSRGGEGWRSCLKRNGKGGEVGFFY